MLSETPPFNAVPDDANPNPDNVTVDEPGSALCPIVSVALARPTAVGENVIVIFWLEPWVSVVLIGETVKLLFELEILVTIKSVLPEFVIVNVSVFEEPVAATPKSNTVSCIVNLSKEREREREKERVREKEREREREFIIYILNKI